MYAVPRRNGNSLPESGPATMATTATAGPASTKDALQRVTATVTPERSPLSGTVDPRSTVPESGLRSGVTVAVTRCSASFVDAGPAVAVVAIVAGPDSGKEFPLRRGTAYIGPVSYTHLRAHE